MTQEAQPKTKLYLKFSESAKMVSLQLYNDITFNMAGLQRIPTWQKLQQYHA